MPHIKIHSVVMTNTKITNPVFIRRYMNEGDIGWVIDTQRRLVIVIAKGGMPYFAKRSDLFYIGAL
jgi:hypothetical protein